MDWFSRARLGHLRRSISYPVVASLPLIEVNLNVKYVVKNGIFLPALENLAKSSHCVPIGKKFCFSIISWDKNYKLGNLLTSLPKFSKKFHQLLSDNGDTAASDDVENKVGHIFERLRLKCRDRINKMVEQSHPEVQPEDSVSNVGTALFRSSVSALT